MFCAGAWPIGLSSDLGPSPGSVVHGVFVRPVGGLSSRVLLGHRGCRVEVPNRNPGVYPGLPGFGTPVHPSSPEFT